MKLREITICPAENGYTIVACYEKKDKTKDQDYCMSNYEEKKYVVEEKEKIKEIVEDLLKNKSNFREDALSALKKDNASEDNEDDKKENY